MAETKDKVITAESLSAVHTYNGNTYLTKSNPTGTGTFTMSGGGNFSDAVNVGSLKMGNATIECNSDNDISITTTRGTYCPYYKVGDSWSGYWYGAGYISGGKSTVLFSVPLAKPIIGNPEINLYAELKVRQNGKYTYGSDAETFAIPDDCTAKLGFGGNSINITSKFNTTTINAINNAPCGVQAYINVNLL